MLDIPSLHVFLTSCMALRIRVRHTLIPIDWHTLNQYITVCLHLTLIVLLYRLAVHKITVCHHWALTFCWKAIPSILLVTWYLRMSTSLTTQDLELEPLDLSVLHRLYHVTRMTRNIMLY